VDGAVVIKQVEPIPIAAVRRRVTVATFLDEYIKAPLWQQVDKRGLKTKGDSVIVYHDARDRMLINHPDGVLADMGLVIDHPFEGDLLLQCVMTPGGSVAHARHVGPYEMLPVIHTDIRAWCTAASHELDGIAWEHYVYWHEDASQRVTDVYYLLRE
jgi:effector-binding domain-containing protein